MPGGDGTGPVGMGPMTGRAAGYCAGYQTPGSANRAGAWGARGRGRGGGRGRRNWFYATGIPGWQRVGVGYPSAAFVPTAAGPQQQIDVLRRQAEDMASALDEIKRRIAELEAEPQEK